MTLTIRPAALRALRNATSSALLLLAHGLVAAAPGAHGPNGEHLDGPAGARATAGLPRVEAKSESFELVAELRGGELAILVDRYETNEPVLGARLEVESGALKVVAAYRAEQGDYVVADAAMLGSLAKPGEHALVFTLLAGKDNDLLDGTLVVGGGTPITRVDPGHAHDPGGHDHHDHILSRAAWMASGVAALCLVAGIAWWRQRRRAALGAQGVL